MSGKQEEVGRLPADARPGSQASPEAASASSPPVSIPDAARGPEMERLVDRLFGDPERQTRNVHFDWGPKAHNLTAEERAAMINRVFDEMDHPILGLAAELSGEAMLHRGAAHPSFDCTTMAELPLTPAQKREGRLAALLTRAADKLRDLARKESEG